MSRPVQAKVNPALTIRVATVAIQSFKWSPVLRTIVGPDAVRLATVSKLVCWFIGDIAAET